MTLHSRNLSVVAFNRMGSAGPNHDIMQGHSVTWIGRYTTCMSRIHWHHVNKHSRTAAKLVPCLQHSSWNHQALHPAIAVADTKRGGE